MFLLIETEQGIRLVDQHALHEKALFLALDPRTGDLLAGGTQELLVPISVHLPAAEAALVEPLLGDLAACGIRATRAGNGLIHVHAHPARLRRLDWPGFFADLAEDGAKAVDRIRERIAHRAACRAAVKAGQELSPAEQLELVRLLHTIDGIEHCPHGRPTTLDLPWAELATRFQR
jgi:DNA mismatch repair protein MutL